MTTTLLLSEKEVMKFWSQVDAQGDCWEWTGALSHGYGRFFCKTLREGRAHRVAWELLVGPIPEGLHIDHLCMNKRCVNPDHLEPVANRVNVARAKGLLVRKREQRYCEAGHPFDAANTYWWGNHRMCKACHARHEKNRRERIKALL